MTAQHFDISASIPAVFARVVSAYPDQPAVECDGERLTYRELWAAGASLARRLRAESVAPGDLVGLWAVRSTSWIVGQLGILLAGAAFVPVNADSPAERNASILRTAGCRVLVTPPGAIDLATGLDRTELRVVPVRADAGEPVSGDRVPGGSVAGEPVAGDSIPPSSGEDVAYVMFTSGSTGQPKGVMVAHRGVTSLVLDSDYVPFGPDLRVLQTGAPTFDASTFEVWGPLLHGGCVILNEAPVFLSSRTLAAAIADTAPTTMWLTAALFSRLAGEAPTCFGGLRDLLVGGDVVNPADAARVLAAAPGLRLVNGYGPTENTTFSTTHRVTLDDPTGPIPIGRAVAHSSAVVLDGAGRETGPDEVGELVVGGPGVALGYVNSPEQTRAAFAEDLDRPGGLVYRTGDLVSRDAEGVLWFHGRADRQVKIRGFRVELDEVEHALLRVVRAGAVVAGDRDGRPEIVAFVEVGSEPDAVRAALAETLPTAMLPSRIVVIGRLPVTNQGKVDRPLLQLMAADGELDHDAPSHPPQADPAAEPVHDGADPVGRAWAAVLGHTDFGPDSSLFELGLDSLSAVSLAAAVALATGVEVNLVDVIQHPTLAGQRALVATRSSAAAATGPVSSGTTLPLTRLQRDLLAQQLLDETSTRYNIPLLLDLPDDVDLARLARAWDEVTERHVALRMAIRADAQVVAEAPGLRRLDAPPQPLVRPFALESGLCRAETWREATGGRRLLLDVHHAVIDGVSLQTVIRDWGHAYERRASRPPSQSYGLAVAALGRGPTPEDLEYWSKRLLGFRGPTALPGDEFAPAGSWEGGTVRKVLDRDLVEAVRDFCLMTGTTPGPTFAAALALLLARLGGVDDVCFGQPTVGRTGVASDVVGMFVATVPLRLRVSGDETFAALARQAGEAAAEATAHGSLSGSDLLGVADAELLGTRGLFDVLLAYQPMALRTARFVGLVVDVEPMYPGQSMVDLGLQIFEREAGYEIVWEFRGSRFSAPTVEALSNYFCAVLAAALVTPHTRVSALEAAERLATTVDLKPEPAFSFDFEEFR